MGVGNVDGVLKIFQVFLRELQGGLGQQNADELLSYIESKRAFGIGYLGASDCRLIAGGLQAPLPLVATLKEIGESDIELLGQVQIVEREIARAKK